MDDGRHLTHPTALPDDAWNPSPPESRRPPFPQIQEPRYQDQHKTYLAALEELAKPLPATHLLDWREFDEMTGGFRPREFSILCGTTGSGKTQWLAALSGQLLRQEIKHFVMSVETGETDFMKRILSDMCGKDLNTGNAVPVSELGRIHVENAKYLESNCLEFALYDNRIPVEQLEYDLRFMCDRGCKLAIIDNLNFFMEPATAANYNLEMDRVTHKLVILCKQIDMHILMVMHPRKPDSGTKVRSEYDIKGSSTAIQEAHNIFLFNRPSPEDVEANIRDYTSRELTIAKMRKRGKYVGRTIVFDLAGMKYIEKGIVKAYARQ